jgi:hypothetical protein
VLETELDGGTARFGRVAIPPAGHGYDEPQLRHRIMGNHGVQSDQSDQPPAAFQLDTELHAGALGEVVGSRGNPQQGLFFGIRKEDPRRRIGDLSAPGQPPHDGGILLHKRPQNHAL